MPLEGATYRFVGRIDDDGLGQRRPPAFTFRFSRFIGRHQTLEISSISSDSRTVSITKAIDLSAHGQSTIIIFCTANVAVEPS